VVLGLSHINSFKGKAFAWRSTNNQGKHRTAARLQSVMGCGPTKDAPAANAAQGNSRSKGNGSSVGSSGILLEKYALGKVLGQGAFGVVYKCKKKATDEEYAVKMIDQVETPLAEIKKEIEMLQKLEHPTCIKLHDVYHEKVFVCMVLDYYKGGDMIQGMMAHWKTKGMIPIANVKFLSKQMHEAVAWVHSMSCVHRDVKGDNFMMGEPLVENPVQRLYLSDFGTVRELKPGERLTQKCGTKNYWPPEFYKLNYAMKVDCWAVGVVMFGLVSGKFPFKGEEDVKYKKLSVPKRCPDEGADLIHSLLERDENKRNDCANAIKHNFIRNEGKRCGEPQAAVEQTPSELKQNGMRDDRANAGVAARRFELVDRLKNKAQGAGTKGADYKAQSFMVHDPATERTLTFEWWEAQKATSLVSAFASAKQLPTADMINREVTIDTVKQLLKDHNVKVDGFGKGGAKTFQDFVSELQKGASRLLLDATQHKFMVRAVDIVMLKLVYRDSEGKTRILVDATEGTYEGRVKPGAALPQNAKLPQENSLQAADRLSKDLLGLKDCQIKWQASNVEAFEESMDSPLYPGIQTVYRKEIMTGEVTATNPSVLSRIAATTGGTFSSKSRNFTWMTESQCKGRKIVVEKPPHTDFSALVYPPIGLEEEELTEFLSKNRIDTSKWGQGTYKSLEDFSEELTKGEATLIKGNDGKIKRVVDIVVLQLTRQETNSTLIEAAETYKESKLDLNRLPAVKRRGDEHQFFTARRMITKYLQLPDNFVTIDPTDVKIIEEEQESKAFFGLPTIYRKRFMKGVLVPDAALA